MNKNHRLLRPVGCVLLAAFAAMSSSGCVGTRTQKVADLPEGAIVTRDYEQVYVTGSHIPVLVPKSPTARRVPTISPLVILTVDDVPRVGIPMR